MSALRGRPKLSESKSDRLYIRVTPREKLKIMEFCNSNELSILDLINVGMSVIKSGTISGEGNSKIIVPKLRPIPLSNNIKYRKVAIPLSDYEKK